MAEGTGLGVEDRPTEASEPDVSDGGFDELYARHIAAGVRLAFLLTGDHTHAEDLAWTPDGVERT